MRLKHIIILSIVITGLIEQLQAQGSNVFYSFDNQSLSHENGDYAAGTVDGTASYECGVGDNSSALNFMGTADTITLDPKVKEFFDNDFTLSFYFWLDDREQNASLLSIENNCRKDSSLLIRYIGVNKQVRIEYSRDQAESVEFNIDLDDQACWHHLVFVRNEETFSAYLNQEFVKSIEFNEDINMGKNFDVRLGFSDCISTIDNLFNGRIDEVQIFDTALGELDIINLNRFPDEIVAVDTTIFEGDFHELFIGPSCTSDISWSPAIGLDDDQSLAPIAMPSESTVYKCTFTHANCTTVDSVRVSIIREEDIDCSNLLLPTAFTPNSDRINDVYGISNFFIISDLTRYEIYDRWGTLLFESNDKRAKWDGAYRGVKAMPSTYVYKIEYVCREENYQKTGSFNLLK